jgi:hypothetical protein
MRCLGFFVGFLLVLRATAVGGLHALACLVWVGCDGRLLRLAVTYSGSCDTLSRTGTTFDGVLAAL